MREGHRLPITDYFSDSGTISMYALASIANRLPTTDHRLLNHHRYPPLSYHPFIELSTRFMV